MYKKESAYVSGDRWQQINARKYRSTVKRNQKKLLLGAPFDLLLYKQAFSLYDT